MKKVIGVIGVLRYLIILGVLCFAAYVFAGVAITVAIALVGLFALATTKDSMKTVVRVIWVLIYLFVLGIICYFIGTLVSAGMAFLAALIGLIFLVAVLNGRATEAKEKRTQMQSGRNNMEDKNNT